jgi:hypothetical protein
MHMTDVAAEAARERAAAWVTRNLRRVPNDYRATIVRGRDSGNLISAIEGVAAAILPEEDITVPDLEIDDIIGIIAAMDLSTDVSKKVEYELSHGRRGTIG